MTDTSPGAVARMLDGVTDGPWQVVETHHQWHLPAADQRKEARGVHVERRIFTLQDHPQLKAPYGVVNGANAIGCSHMISISAEDARFIAWSREAVPALAAERDTVTAERDALAQRVAELEHEPHWDDHCVNQFAKMMREKMALSREKGRSGWDDPKQCSVDYLRHILYEHLDKGDPVDVANICMMLRHYDASTARDYGNTVDLMKARAEAAEAENQRMRELLSRAPLALNGAFSAGMEEREGGSARRQGKYLESVDQLRADIRAALAQGDKT